MSTLSLLQKTWNRNILFSALVELTYRCNLDCYFCYNDLGLRGEPLTDEAYFRLFEDLAVMQVMNLTFTGGEPLAHPSFLELGERARELGFVVRIKSNGHAFGGRLAREIVERVDPFVVDVSLHGATAEIHDRQTRVPGSFDRLMTNLATMRDLGLRLKLNGTLTRWNEDQIEAMFELADRLGIRLSISPTVTPRDDGDTSPLTIAPSRDSIKRLYAYLDARVSDAEAGIVDPPEAGGTCTGTPGVDKNCGAGSAGIAIDPFGTVYPCVQWRKPLGSLHQQSIREIWKAPILEEVRETSRAARRRVDEKGTDAFGLSHCMGLSEEKTGDPLADDPVAVENARLLREARRERRGLLPVIQ
ncbi:MAG: radical SAM protein [Acidobacteriota bacterium]